MILTRRGKAAALSVLIAATWAVSAFFLPDAQPPATTTPQPPHIVGQVDAAARCAWYVTPQGAWLCNEVDPGPAFSPRIPTTTTPCDAPDLCGNEP